MKAIGKASHSFGMLQTKRGIFALSGICLVLLILLQILPAKAAVITEWNVPGGTSSFPQYLAVDSSSNVWFTEFGSDEIGKLTFGTFTEYSLPAGSRPIGLFFRNDQIWFTESVRNRIGRIGTGGGALTEYLVGDPPYGAMELWGIAYQNETRVWFTSSATSRVGLLNLTKPYKGLGNDVSVKYWVLPGFSASPASNPRGIAYSSTTGIWFVDYNLHRIGNIRDPLTSEVRLWQLPDGSFPFDITIDSYGNVWFTESGRSRIGMLDPDTNEITEYITPTANSEPYGITVDISNRVWFAEHGANKIARYVPGVNTFTEFARAASGAPWGITTDKDGNPPIWFSDGVMNRIGRLSPFDGLTTTVGSTLSTASTTSTTTQASTATLSTVTTTTLYYSTTSLTSIQTGVSQTQTGTTSTLYTATETVTLIRGSTSEVTTQFSTATATTTLSTTVTGTSTSYVATVTNTATTTLSVTSTSYIDTVSATFTSTKTLTATTTTFDTTSAGAIPGFPTASILVGLLLGATFLVLTRRIVRRHSR